MPAAQLSCGLAAVAISRRDHIRLANLQRERCGKVPSLSGQQLHPRVGPRIESPRRVIWDHALLKRRSNSFVAATFLAALRRLTLSTCYNRKNILRMKDARQWP